MTTVGRNEDEINYGKDNCRYSCKQDMIQVYRSIFSDNTHNMYVFGACGSGCNFIGKDAETEHEDHAVKHRVFREDILI